MLYNYIDTKFSIARVILAFRENKSKKLYVLYRNMRYNLHAFSVRLYLRVQTRM